MATKSKNKGSVEELNSEVQQTAKVMGGKLLVFGDLHLSAVYDGQHKNYLYECYFNMDRIKEICKKETPSAIFLLGDIIGVNERNIKDHQFLMRVIMFFEALNSMTNGNVYAVKGNHDSGDFSDYDLLLGLNLIKNPSYVDYYGDSGLEVRLHLVNYGKEQARLNLTKEDDIASDVVLGHNNYYIDGVTTWYSDRKSSVIVSNLDNMKGVDLIISGHIHDPSTEVLSTTIGDQLVNLFYPGSPSRTAERFDECWYMRFFFEDDSTHYEVEEFGLLPSNEVFFAKEVFIDEEVEEEEERTKRLNDLIKDIIEGRLTGGDLYSQIDVVPGFSAAAKELAKSYLDKAEKEA